MLAEVNRLNLVAESNPDKFHRVTFMPLLAKARYVVCVTDCLPLLTLRREQVAALVGAQHDEVVFVPNTTHGINTILRNIEWRQGDVILNSRFCACRHAWQRHSRVASCSHGHLRSGGTHRAVPR